MAVKKAVRKHKKGNVYLCSVCGLEVKVNTPCDCDDCGIICCGQVMKLKKEK